MELFTEPAQCGACYSVTVDDEHVVELELLGVGLTGLCVSIYSCTNLPLWKIASSAFSKIAYQPGILPKYDGSLRLTSKEGEGGWGCVM